MAATTTAGVSEANGNLHVWRGVEGYQPQHLLRRHLRRPRSVLLGKESRQKGVFSFEDHMLSTTKAHVMGEKPCADTYQPHAMDSSDIETAEELRFEGFTKLISRKEVYTIYDPTHREPRSSCHRDHLLHRTLMMREVLGGLAVRDLLTTRADLADNARI